MGDFLTEIQNNVDKAQQEFIGPTYPYYDNIKTPSQLGMGSKGTIKQVGEDIEGLIDYVKILVSGNSNASATGKPLGNKFFLKTGAKCKPNVETKTVDASNNQVDRYIYVDNVPHGNIPFISAGLGVNFKEFKGLIPGTMSNLNVLNPYGIMQSFMMGNTPPCQELTMETIDNKNNKSVETHYVATVDIKNMDPCSFSNRTNPVTNQKCKETFNNNNNNNNIGLPDDPIVQLYFLGLSLVGVYIFMRLIDKSK